jgi:hypothetical protein
MITQELVCSLFEYRDGKLFWKARKNGRTVGKEAGSVSPSHGYRQIHIHYKHYLTHRIVYLMFKGYLPKFLDHIDGDSSNNKIENLREATAKQNQRNKGIDCRNKTGVKNVSKRGNKYRVSFTHEGSHIHVGCYDTVHEAAQIAKQTRLKLHKEFTKHE